MKVVPRIREPKIRVDLSDPSLFLPLATLLSLYCFYHFLRAQCSFHLLDGGSLVL